MKKVALLDVNVLVALFQPDHVHHELAHDWFAENRRAGWATCPITETGLVRLLANPRFHTAASPCQPSWSDCAGSSPIRHTSGGKRTSRSRTPRCSS